MEAETAARRLKELRQHEENRRREAMRSRQTAERLGIEEAHMLEFEQFNAIWEQRMQVGPCCCGTRLSAVGCRSTRRVLKKGSRS